MPSDTEPAWKRLGDLLVRRRIELDPRYRNRRLFTSERGAEYRIVNAIERGERSNYEPATLSALEVAYSLAPGAILRAADGAGLQPQPETRATAPPPGPVRLPHLYGQELEPYLAGVRDDLAEAMRAYGPGFTGDQAFPHDGLEAEAWDTPRLTPDESMRQIAWLRLFAAERDQRQSGSGRETGLWRT